MDQKPHESTTDLTLRRDLPHEVGRYGGQELGNEGVDFSHGVLIPHKDFTTLAQLVQRIARSPIHDRETAMLVSTLHNFVRVIPHKLVIAPKEAIIEQP